MSDNRVLWCFLSSPPTRTLRDRSLVAPLHMLVTSCARLLSRSLSQRPCLGARVGVDSARRPGLFGLPEATPRVVGCLTGAPARTLSCLGLPRLVFVCLMPVPSNRRRSRVRRELEVAAASDESSLKLFKVSPVIDISDSKFSVWLSDPDLIGYYIWPENIEPELLFYSNLCCHVLPHQLSIRKTRSGHPEHFAI